MARWNKRRRLLVQWALASGAIVVASISWAIAGRSGVDQTVLPGASVEGLTAVLAKPRPSNPTPIRFREVTEEVGIAFHHFPGQRSSLLPEDMGSGVACHDYDSDGWVDVFFVNVSGPIIPGETLGVDTASARADKPPVTLSAPEGRSRLYRNIGGRRFEDVTDHAGVGFVGCGMGAAWGDYDNDGDADLYVTAYGPNVLYENLGDGVFRDSTARSGTQDPRFSTGCVWADYDRDGDLDLYVCNYVDFTFREQDRGAVRRQYATEQPYTLNPSAYRPQPNSLFRNRGDGTFEEVAAATGVDDPNGRGLSASWVDMNNDGWPDLYVANDVSNNGVFLNLLGSGGSVFEDVGPSSLAADYRGAMGIAVADFDNDLDHDLLITHWIAQENALFRNMSHDQMLGDSPDGALWFMDVADQVGLGQLSLDMVGWATGFCDLDNDGRRDLWIINGSTLESSPGAMPKRRQVGLVRAGMFPSEDHRQLVSQPAFVFWNRGEDGFVDVTRQAAERLSTPFVGRGAAQVDFDRDGRVDLIAMVHGGRAFVLKNVSEPAGHWLAVELRQSHGNTDALGARVYVTAGGHIQMAEVGVGSSYLSQHQLALHFGLGDATMIDSLRIVWPDGSEQILTDAPVDRYIRVEHVGDYGR